MGRAFAPLVAIGLLTVSACSESPGPPSAPSTPTTVTPTTPPVREVTIIGAPSNVQIGKTVQVRAASRADDGIQDVTDQATWQSSDLTVCAVSAGGIVEGRGAGSATLTARYSGASGTATLTCGFVINALVHENEPTTAVLLAGARVEVAGGPLDGKTFETDAGGRVSLPPVAAPGFALYFKKAGYDDRRLEIFELPRQTALDVAVFPAPITQFDLTTSCTRTSSGNRNFKTLREGTIRLTVDGGAHADVYGPSHLHVQSQGGLEQAETVARAGEYELYYDFLKCSAGVPTRVLVEYPR